MAETASQADFPRPDDGIIDYPTVPFDGERHRADLERWVVLGGLTAMNLLIVFTFVVLMWGPVSAKTALAPVMTALGGVILGVLACAFHPFKNWKRSGS